MDEGFMSCIRGKRKKRQLGKGMGQAEGNSEEGKIGLHKTDCQKKTRTTLQSPRGGEILRKAIIKPNCRGGEKIWPLRVRRAQWGAQFVILLGKKAKKRASQGLIRKESPVIPVNGKTVGG